MIRPRSFFFHYNKPKSQQTGKPVISLHYKNTCHFVDNVECRVPVKGRLKKTQPRFVMAGKAHSIRIKNGVATIQ